MFTIMIVDDEKIVRDGLRKTISWKDLDCEIVAEASNGLDGYKKYLEYCPDIIITDIRMKRANGLELIQKLTKTEGFDSEIIIFTAFDEFDYVKTALENGAGGYLLKPIKDSELIEVIEKSKSKLSERRRKNDLLEKMAGHVEDMRDRFILSVLSGQITDQKEILEQCAFFQIDLPQEDFVAACVKIDNLQMLNGKLKKANEGLQKSVEHVETLPGSPRFIRTEAEEGVVYLLLEGADKNAAINYLSELQEQFEVMTGLTLSAGYSKLHRGIASIPTAHQEALRALAHKSFLGNRSIIDFTGVPTHMNSALIFSNDDTSAVLAAVKRGDKEGAKAILTPFFNKIKDTPTIDVESYKNVILEMAIVLLRSNFKNSKEISEAYGREVIPAQELRRLENIDDIQNWLEEILDKLFTQTCTDKKNTDSKKIREIKAIIQRDYMKEITIEQVAEELHISSYYLMHSFKEETGNTFNQYLTEVRIAKAIELLQSGQHKVYEIGELVGYKNPMYFSYIFKKMTGSTPKKYIQEG